MFGNAGVYDGGSLGGVESALINDLAAEPHKGAAVGNEQVGFYFPDESRAGGFTACGGNADHDSLAAAFGNCGKIPLRNALSAVEQRAVQVKEQQADVSFRGGTVHLTAGNHLLTAAFSARAQASSQTALRSLSAITAQGECRYRQGREMAAVLTPPRLL